MTSCSPRPRSPGSGSSWLCLRTRLSQAAAAQPCTRRTVRPVGPRPAPGPATGRARNNGAMTCGQPCRSRPRSQCIRQYLFANGRSPGGLPSAGFSCRTRNGPGSCSRRTRSEPAGCGRWRCALCTAMVCTTSGGRHRSHVRQAAAMGHVDPLDAWRPEDWAMGRVQSAIVSASTVRSGADSTEPTRDRPFPQLRQFH